jgi:hypothetical protein
MVYVNYLESVPVYGLAVEKNEVRKEIVLPVSRIKFWTKVWIRRGISTGMLLCTSACLLV